MAYSPSQRSPETESKGKRQRAGKDFNEDTSNEPNGKGK